MPETPVEAPAETGVSGRRVWVEAQPERGFRRNHPETTAEKAECAGSAQPPSVGRRRAISPRTSGLSARNPSEKLRSDWKLQRETRIRLAWPGLNHTHDTRVRVEKSLLAPLPRRVLDDARPLLRAGHAVVRHGHLKRGFRRPLPLFPSARSPPSRSCESHARVPVRTAQGRAANVCRHALRAVRRRAHLRAGTREVQLCRAREGGQSVSTAPAVAPLSSQAAASRGPRAPRRTGRVAVVVCHARRCTTSSWSPCSSAASRFWMLLLSDRPAHTDSPHNARPCQRYWT